MKTYECAKCGSKEVFIKEMKGQIPQVGLYCSDCGKWIKWLGKEERRLAERYIESCNTSCSVELKKYSKEEVRESIWALRGFSSEDYILNSIDEVLKMFDNMED